MKYILPIVTSLLVSACASSGSYTPSGKLDADTQEAFANGKIRLKCNLECSREYGSKRRDMKALHDDELWHDLAFNVTSIGYDKDQAYYYLGRSAEGLGYLESALKYYKLASISRLKCSSLTCDGFVFPNDLDKRRQVVEKKLLVARPQALSQKTQAHEKQLIQVSTPKASIASFGGTIPDQKKASTNSASITDIVQTNFPPKPLKYGSMADLRNDLKKLKTPNLLAKDPFETQADFELRKQKFINKYNHKAYRVNYEIDNPQNEQDKLAFYNPESGVLTVSISGENLDLIHTKINGVREKKFLRYTWVPVHTIEASTDSYEASNQLGRTVTVKKIQSTTLGIAILAPSTSSNSQENTQSFSVYADREAARRILKSGKIELEIQSDILYQEDVDAPFLLEKVGGHKPTFDMPILLLDIKYALPVRLLTIALRDEKGIEILKEKGRVYQALP